MMTPKEAQHLTVTLWKKRALGHLASVGACGWCIYSRHNCEKCPLPIVFKFKPGCRHFLPYVTYIMTCESGDVTSEAQTILDLLIEKEKEILAIAGERCVTFPSVV